MEKSIKILDIYHRDQFSDIGIFYTVIPFDGITVSKKLAKKL